MKYKYPFIVYPAEEGGYVAEVLDLPGCFTQGDSPAELIAMLEDAIAAWLEVAGGEPWPADPEAVMHWVNEYIHRRAAK